MGNCNDFVLNNEEVVEKLVPTPARKWKSLDRESSKKAKPTFTLCCMNVLAPRYCHASAYPFCPKKYLAANYRFKKVLSQLTKVSDLDVICLQELQQSVLNAGKSIFEKDYGCVYKQISEEDSWNYKPDDCSYWKDDQQGIGIFFKKTKFELMKSYPMDLNTDAFFEVWKNVEDTSQRSTFIYAHASLGSHNVGLCCLLKEKLTGMKILVCTIHANFHYQNWIRQTHQLEVFFKKIGEIEETYDEIVICGDFNAEPDSPGIEFIRNGEISNYDKVSSAIVEDNKNIYKVLGRYPRHNIKGLEEAYSSELKKFTKRCHRSNRRKVLDYIWYRKSKSFEIQSVLEISEEIYEADFPNSRIPSDHIMLGARFCFTNGEGDSKIGT